MTNVNNPYYWDYYWVRTMHRSEKISLYEVNEEDDVHKMDSILSTSNSKYFIYAWSTKPNPDGVFKVIDSHYPHLIADPQHFNSGIRLYSK
jgi:hypothetical protein